MTYVLSARLRHGRWTLLKHDVARSHPSIKGAHASKKGCVTPDLRKRRQQLVRTDAMGPTCSLLSSCERCTSLTYFWPLDEDLTVMVAQVYEPWLALVLQPNILFFSFFSFLFTLILFTKFASNLLLKYQFFPF